MLRHCRSTTASWSLAACRRRSSVSRVMPETWVRRLSFSAFNSTMLAWQNSSEVDRLATCAASCSRTSSLTSRSMMTSSFPANTAMLMLLVLSPVGRSASFAGTALPLTFCCFAPLFSPLVFAYGEVLAMSCFVL